MSLETQSDRTDLPPVGTDATAQIKLSGSTGNIPQLIPCPYSGLKSAPQSVHQCQGHSHSHDVSYSAYSRDLSSKVVASASEESTDTEQDRETRNDHELPELKPATSESQIATSKLQTAWEKISAQPILPIRCNETNAELHKDRLGSGGKGQCVQIKGEWYTPTEFEALAGRGSCKDWKRSIRFGGRPLQVLIDQGYLVVHSTSCGCRNCKADTEYAGPFIPYTPQRPRKRRGQQPVVRVAEKPDPLVEAVKRAKTINHDRGTADDAWRALEQLAAVVSNSVHEVQKQMREVKEKSQMEIQALRSLLKEKEEETERLKQTLTQQKGPETRTVMHFPQLVGLLNSNQTPTTYSMQVFGLNPATNCQELQIIEIENKTETPSQAPTTIKICPDSVDLASSN